MLFTVFKRARHLGCYPQSNESNTALTFHFSNNHSILFFQLRRVYKWSFLGFSNQTPYAGFMSPHASYFPRQTHPPNADHPYNSGEEYELWSPSLCRFLHHSLSLMFQTSSPSSMSIFRSNTKQIKLKLSTSSSSDFKDIPRPHKACVMSSSCYCFTAMTLTMICRCETNVITVCTQINKSEW